jgi:hypothetical protein
MISRSRFLLALVATVAAAFFPERVSAISDEDLAAYLRVQAVLEKRDKPPALEKAEKLEKRIPIVREKETQKQAARDKRYSAGGRIELIRDVSKPRVRRSFADLLATEAGDVGDFEPAGRGKLLKDLKPATFAYTNDFENGFDTWTAEAAVIWPFVFKTGVTRGGQFRVPLFGIMPSFSINRFTSTEKGEDALGQAKIEDSETDEVIYRLGSFAKLDFSENLFAVVRANALWQTDTGHDASEPGFEIEFEPLWQSKSNPALGLGFLAIPQWAKRPGFDGNDPDSYRHAWLGYQARLRARFLGGSERDDGEGKKGVDYLRAGLTAGLHLEPFIFERLAVSVSYSFLPAICGPIDQDFYLESALAYTIFETKDGSQKVTAELKYLWGAPDNKGKKVHDQLTASIGVMF